MVKADRPLNVLISHSPKDLFVARELCHQLNAEGWMDLWFIESNLQISQNWEKEIREAVDRADVVIILLSKYLEKRNLHVYPDPGFVLDTLQSNPKRKILVLPLQLDSYNIPTNLKSGDAIICFPQGQRKLAYANVLDRLKVCAEQLGRSTVRREPAPEPEESIQWSPSIWKKLAVAEFDSRILGMLPDDSPADMPQPFERNSSGRIHRFPFRVSTGIFLTLFLLGLFVNYLAGNQLVDFIRASNSSNGPTPAPGIGSTSISPKDGMKMVFVPGGEFIMGGEVYYHENPIHLVRLNAFWIDQTEVTNAMFAAFLNQHSNLLGDRITALDTNDEHARIHLADGAWQADQDYEAHPVVEVTWYGAAAYCSWAGRRLPTEAEWEKAARGTKEHIYPWGNDEPDVGVLNFNGVIGDTTKVGSYPKGASPYGVLDMAGNVWEWTADWYDETYYIGSPSMNPVGPDSGSFRVLRGGAWNYRDTYARSSHRNLAAPIVSHDFIGFRCVRSE